MYENYMDYCDDNVQNIFTYEQAQRLNATLTVYRFGLCEWDAFGSGVDNGEVSGDDFFGGDAQNPSLLEAELFGHRAGAMPGAATDRAGAFEAAHGGTLLLDEVGDLPLSLQARLLRVLQDGVAQRLGEAEARPVDVRVLAISGPDLLGAVETGQFREDLYYRLAGVCVHVPPLRERRDDIPDLADHFLLAFAREAEAEGRAKDVRGLTDDALKQLMAQEWRGNVRELQNVLRLAWIRAPEGGRIAPEHLVQPSGGRPRRAPPMNLAELENQAIRRAMDRSDGNMAAAARLLGIDRSTLWRKLKKGE